jgi:hypothetical protein
MSIAELYDMTDDERNILNTQTVYANYIIKILTKKEADDKIKHTILNHPDPVNLV